MLKPSLACHVLGVYISPHGVGRRVYQLSRILRAIPTQPRMQGCHTYAVSSMQVLHGRISASPNNLNHGRVVFVEDTLSCSGKKSLPQIDGRKQNLVVSIVSARQLRFWRGGRHTVLVF